MSLWNWLGKAARHSRQQARNRLCLELLETRCVPSTVTNLSDHDPGSLREAIATTPSGGTVDFQPGLSGIIVLTTGELAINKDLSIEGPGANVITVSAGHASRVLNIANFTVALSGLTIADGMVLGQSGGGILNYGTLSIMGTTFSANFSNYDCGGLYNNGGSVGVTECAFSGNAAPGNGGGIYNNRGTVTVIGSTFSGNIAAGGGGGGIRNLGTLTITGSTFSGNSAGFGGGGIENRSGGMVHVTDSTFSGNSGGFYGGGGIENLGKLTIRNSLLAGGRGNFSFGPDVDGPLNSLGHNLIGIGDGGSGYAPTDLVGTSATPIDPKLGNLQDNGGPTETIALLPGSPAIGAGGPTDSEWDQRGPGYARTVNGRTDIGAYEVQAGEGGGSRAQPPAIAWVRETRGIEVAVSTAAPVVAQRPRVPLNQAVTAVDRVFASETNVAGWRHAALPARSFWPFDVFVPERGRD